MTIAVQLDNLVVHAGGRVILGVEHLHIATGELIGLLGPNGAGKSTLLRCLLGMQGRMCGDIRVLDQSVNRCRCGELAKLRRCIGYVPQLLPVGGEMPLTVREVVAIGRTAMAGLCRSLKASDWRLVDQWIERLGLAALAEQSFSQISGGEQRKTLIARAMVQQPEMLLLDEPTANLDLGWRERIVRIIDELYRSMRLTVVLVCHELEVLPGGCQRVVVLNEGRIAADGPPEQWLTTELVASLYGDGLDVVRHGERWAVLPGSGGRDA